jgi:hypothetical protein
MLSAGGNSSENLIERCSTDFAELASVATSIVAIFAVRITERRRQPRGIEIVYGDVA